MKYDLLFLGDDFKARADRPNMKNLPGKCCAKCDEWVATHDGAGACCYHSTFDWDAFSWADDCCGQFHQEEESVTCGADRA